MSRYATQCTNSREVVLACERVAIPGSRGLLSVLASTSPITRLLTQVELSCKSGSFVYPPKRLTTVWVEPEFLKLRARERKRGRDFARARSRLSPFPSMKYYFTSPWSEGFLRPFGLVAHRRRRSFLHFPLWMGRYVLFCIRKNPVCDEVDHLIHSVDL
jgi:hypothetical protein